MLDPMPRDFTQATGLNRDRIVATLLAGKPGTAMRPFDALLSSAEIEDVATFVYRTFVQCAAANTRYHTVANGWPDHELRYGAAFGFATGELPHDLPEHLLDPDERRGLALFRSACISCHEGRLVDSTGLNLTSPGETGASVSLWTGIVDHADEYDTPTVHDILPELPNPTRSQEIGRGLYTDACAQCHAADGTGRNWVGKFLRPNPPDFTSQAFRRRFDPAEFSRMTLDAAVGTTMPSFRGIISVQDSDAIADYVNRVFIAPQSVE
jgi:cytochrome c oxidase cbb3-type subunit 3